LLARATDAERKRDTRRKIIIGGAALAAVQHKGVPTLPTPDKLLAWLEPRLTRPHDRAAFDLPPQKARCCACAVSLSSVRVGRSSTSSRTTRSLARR
jgi:hypothetical protein